jgi:hypothetical protein
VLEVSAQSNICENLQDAKWWLRQCIFLRQLIAAAHRAFNLTCQLSFLNFTELHVTGAHLNHVHGMYHHLHAHGIYGFCEVVDACACFEIQDGFTCTAVCAFQHIACILTSILWSCETLIGFFFMFTSHRSAISNFLVIFSPILQWQHFDNLDHIRPTTGVPTWDAPGQWNLPGREFPGPSAE